MSRGKSLHYLPIWSTFAVLVLAQVRNSRRLGRGLDLGLTGRSLRSASISFGDEKLRSRLQSVRAGSALGLLYGG